ncbi:MAG: hypothetical protein ACJ760_00830 [Thermoleophilaceae bacterium]
MSDALHDAAIRHLTGVLATTRPPPVLAGDWPADERAPRALEACVAIGAMDANEAGEWRARFERASEPWTDPDPELRRRALAHLEELDRAGGDVVTAINALIGARAIQPSDAEPSLAPLRLPIGDAGDDFGAQREFDDSRFVRAVLGPAARESGMRVTFVELYEGGTVVNWHMSATAGGPDAAALWSRLSRNEFLDDDPEDLAELDDEEFFGFGDPVALEDDAGTRYRGAEGASMFSDRGRYASGYACFATAVPAAATRLEVQVTGAGRITVAL